MRHSPRIASHRTPHRQKHFFFLKTELVFTTNEINRVDDIELLGTRRSVSIGSSLPIRLPVLHFRALLFVWTAFEMKIVATTVNLPSVGIQHRTLSCIRLLDTTLSVAAREILYRSTLQLIFRFDVYTYLHVYILHRGITRK